MAKSCTIWLIWALHERQQVSGEIHFDLDSLLAGMFLPSVTYATASKEVSICAAAASLAGSRDLTGITAFPNYYKARSSLESVSAHSTPCVHDFLQVLSKSLPTSSSN